MILAKHISFLRIKWTPKTYLAQISWKNTFCAHTCSLIWRFIRSSPLHGNQVPNDECRMSWIVLVKKPFQRCRWRCRLNRLDKAWRPNVLWNTYAGLLPTYCWWLTEFVLGFVLFFSDRLHKYCREPHMKWKNKSKKAPQKKWKQCWRFLIRTTVECSNIWC